MVTGGYTLDLMCDCLECQNYKGSPEYRTEERGFKQLTGQTFTECYREAKRRGWWFNANKTHCIAPGHEYRRKEPTNEQ